MSYCLIRLGVLQLEKSRVNSSKQEVTDMKNFLFYASFGFVFISTFLFGYQDNPFVFTECEQTHANPYQAHVNNKLFILLQETDFQTATAQSDTQELFSPPIEVNGWDCPYCGWGNTNPRKNCLGCGEERPKR